MPGGVGGVGQENRPPLSRLLDKPGPERGGPLCKYLFWIDPIGMNAVRGGSGKSRRAAGCAAPISRKRPISRPGPAFRAAAPLSVGKLKSRARPWAGQH